MAETEDGKKFNRIAKYTRIVDGKKQTVKAHVKSNSPYSGTALNSLANVRRILKFIKMLFARPT